MGDDSGRIRFGMDMKPNRGGATGENRGVAVRSFLAADKVGSRPVIKPMPYAKQTPRFSFGDEVIDTIEYFEKRGLICRFNNHCPGLPALDSWFSKQWRPLIEDNVNIYPSAHGIFIAVFDSFSNKEIIFRKIWEFQSHLLLMKPYTP